MSEQRMPSSHNGRRKVDQIKRAGVLFGAILGLIAVLNIAATTWGTYHQLGIQVGVNASGIDSLEKRVTSLEQIKMDDHYMTCFMFQKANPDGVPTSCNLALRHK